MDLGLQTAVFLAPPPLQLRSVKRGGSRDGGVICVGHGGGVVLLGASEAALEDRCSSAKPKVALSVISGSLTQVARAHLPL